jgi:hypothetical protein
VNKDTTRFNKIVQENVNILSSVAAVRRKYAMNLGAATIRHQYVTYNISGDSFIAYTAFKMKTISISQNAVTVTVESLARPA